jgi:hypothetical protein
MADAAYEGLFYSFESKAEFDALVKKVHAKCVATENGCEIWSGSMMKYGREQYNLRKLIFQAANPGIIPTALHKVVCSCDNDKCISAAHLLLSVKNEWDVDEIYIST